MNRARDSSETNQYSSVPGHDQPSSGGSSEAPPRLCMDQSVACTPSCEVCSADWGVPFQCNAGVAALLWLDWRTPQGADCAPHTCPVCCGHCNVEKRYSPNP